MEKRTRTSSKAKDFFKKNMYYLIMAVCLIAVAAMIAVTVIMKNPPDQNGIINPPDEPTIIEPVVDDPEPVDKPDIIPDTNPVVTPVVFACPVDNVNILQDYVANAPVWYTTLGHYAVHEAIDFGGQDGDKVYSAYAGVVSDIEYDPFQGNVVTIKHSDTLTTRYESLNTPTVTVGQKVLKGAQIGTMANTATREYDLGAHLHFSVFENGEEISPYTYLAIGDK